jgi:hypothetical protein
MPRASPSSTRSASAQDLTPTASPTSNRGGDIWLSYSFKRSAVVMNALTLDGIRIYLAVNVEPRRMLSFVGMITMEMMRMKSHILLFLIGVLYQTAKYHRSEV